MANRFARLPITLVIVVVVVAAAAVGGDKLWRALQDKFSSTGCDIGSYQLTTDQASVAAQMVGAVTKYRPRLPERAAVLVLAAGLQESKLENLAPGQGDRDSVGVLQQRPSQGWGGGVASRLNDVTEATTEFLDALVKVPHWRTLKLAVAVQKVQISADGSLYAQHEPEAQALADALIGRKAAGISCSFDAPTVVAPVRKVGTMLTGQLATRKIGYSTRTIRVPATAKRKSWQLTSWFVAFADRLGIDSVAYAGKKWSREDGWQAAPASTGHAVVAVMAVVQKS